jgi:CRP-like cAMP-binding protein
MNLTFFLKNLPAFEDFQPAQLSALADHLQMEEHENGHVFIKQGEQGKALFLLMQGAVHITRHENKSEGDSSEEIAVRELADGEMFGILSLVDELPASASCTARGATKVAVLSNAAFQQLFNDAPAIARHLQYMIAVQMARDLQEANKRFRASLTLS